MSPFPKFLHRKLHGTTLKRQEESSQCNENICFRAIIHLHSWLQAVNVDRVREHNLVDIFPSQSCTFKKSLIVGLTHYLRFLACIKHPDAPYPGKKPNVGEL